MKIEWWKIKTNKQCKEIIGEIVYEPYTPSRVGKIIDAYMK